MMVGVDLEAILRSERLLSSREVRGSPDAVAALLADGFVEFTRPGTVCGKADVVGHLAAEDGAQSEPAACGFALTPLASDVVLPACRTIRTRGDGGAIHTSRSSIWRRTGGRWAMVLHQGTPARC